MKLSSIRTSIPIVASTLAMLLAASSAAAMTKGTGTSNITAKAAANPWVGSPSPATVYPGTSSCAFLGPCSGWYETFSNWARIYSWDDTSSTQTRIVGGMILNAYAWFNHANGFLGYPRTDELDTPGYTGKKQIFQGATVYYRWGATGAFEIHGWIEQKWNALGATQSELGFPTSGEETYGGGKRNFFENGEVIWSGVVGSWQNDVWPVMTSVSATPTRGTTRWITGRATNTTNPTYVLYGCGFTPSSTVTVRVNNRSARLSLGTTTADASGCFTKSTGAISSTYNIGGVVTFDADDGTTNGHHEVVGLPWSFTDCYRASPYQSYYMVHKEGRATWCVDPNLWASNHADILSFDLGFPEEAMSQIESDFSVPYGGADLTVEVYDGGGAFWTPSAFGPGVVIPGNAFLASPPDWGNIAIMQELVNQYTAYIGGFWPRDWWADHKSPFPTMVNWRVLDEMGLSSAYATEFDYNHGSGPSSNSSSHPDHDPYFTGTGVVWDPQVTFFESLATPAQGWTTFASMFQYMKQDGIDLGAVDVGEISKLRSEYTLAYLSLGHGDDVTGAAIDAHVGEIPYLYVSGVYNDCWRENPGCGPGAGAALDWSLVEYEPDTAVVTSIADAHCRVRAAYNQGDTYESIVARNQLRGGYYTGALGTLSATGLAVCGAGCPSECGCHASHCAAPWH